MIYYITVPINIIMSNIQFTLSATYNFKQEEQDGDVTISHIKPLSGDIIVTNIIDRVEKKELYVDIHNLGHFKLDNMSGDMYDSPSDWTKTKVKNAVKNFIAINSI